ncbi:MAG: magnesium transporter [Alphaproteobacteria bacterium]|nr:magnesium transporter [Alphaproteobacteria bacterium]
MTEAPTEIIEFNVPTLEALVEQREISTLRTLLTFQPLPQIVSVMVDLAPSARALVFRLLPHDIAVEVFSNLEAEEQDELLQHLSDQETRKLLADLSPDDRTLLFEEMPGEVAQKLFKLLSADDLEETHKLLGYPEESVGRLMTPDYIAIRPSWTIDRAIEEIRREGRDSETVNRVYVIDRQGKLLDAIRLRQLILAEPKDNVKDIMAYQTVSLSAYDDREEAVRQMRDYDVFVLPVVDSDNVLLGIVTFDDVLDVAEEEATEDIHKSSGMKALRKSYRNASPWMLVQGRIGWLAILVVAHLFSSGALAANEAKLQASVALAFFVPLLIGTGGNSGSQAATMMVRALVTDDIQVSHWWRALLKESVVGILLGFGLALLAAGLGYYRGGFEIARIVGLSMITIVMVANLVGVALPFILTRLKIDPTTASSPLIATICDVVGLMVYFGIAGYFLGI